RMIRFPKIQKAIVDGYRRHMPTDRYPIVVMNIHVDPQLVDVNIYFLWFLNEWFKPWYWFTEQRFFDIRLHGNGTWKGNSLWTHV
ncbi:hypothetical protein PT108_08825, partial [Erysipelothrix rhusiopathiae]|nr:hypothetical protein [Erysipelothrix rhusiopathiae]